MALGNSIGSPSAPTAAQERDLAAWRFRALDMMPYLASLLFSMRVVHVEGLGTMGVDNHMRLYIDFDYAREQGPEWSGMVLLHECLHVFACHGDRAKAAGVQFYEGEISNLAADGEINDDLAAAGVDIADGITPKGLGCDNHRTYEEYLAHLRNESPDQPQSGQGDGGGGGNGQGSGGGGDGGGQGDSGGGCGSGGGSSTMPWELDPSDSLSGAAPAATDIERERVLITTASDITRAAGSGIGTVPGGLVERAIVIIEPAKVSWRRVLASSMKSAMSSKMGMTDPTSRRPSRRHSRGRVIRPGWVTPEQSIVVVRDTSGSMGTAEMQEVNSEIVGIAKQVGVRGRNLTMLDVDTAVASQRGYLRHDDLAEISGRGGTDMGAGIDAALKVRPRPTAIVVVTDGMTPWGVQREPGVKVVVALVGPSAATAARSVPDWAHAVVVGED